MITCNLKGGLGNQLFQIFTTISYALENHHPFAFLKQDILGGPIVSRTTYWNTFLKPLQSFLFPSMPQSCLQVREEGFQYKRLAVPPEISQSSTTIVLNGYFQSYKYFEKHYDIIYRLLRIKTHQQRFTHVNECVSMHFRVGDYKYLGHFHPIMNVFYYKQALNHIISETNESNQKVIYFCEKEDNEEVLKTIDELKIQFPECTFEKAQDNMDDWEEMILMTCCKHHIIANSSFSWFGAYLNENSKKIVCYPSKWFCGHGEHVITTDLFLPSWNKIEC
jgi:hypothetical protein